MCEKCENTGIIILKTDSYGFEYTIPCDCEKGYEYSKSVNTL